MNRNPRGRLAAGRESFHSASHSGVRTWGVHGLAGDVSAGQDVRWESLPTTGV